MFFFLPKHEFKIQCVFYTYSTQLNSDITFSTAYALQWSYQKIKGQILNIASVFKLK